MLRLYNSQASSIILEYPLYIKFTGEAGVDEGGIQRDMFSAFWVECYSKLFEGSTTVVPMVYPQIDMSQYITIGRIISHGYMATGILPDRVALPVLIASLLGPGIEVPNHVLIEAFMDLVSGTERASLKDAINSTANASSFQPNLLNKLICILSRFGSRQVPTPSSLSTMIVRTARYEFCIVNACCSLDYAAFWSIT